MALYLFTYFTTTPGLDATARLQIWTPLLSQPSRVVAERLRPKRSLATPLFTLAKTYSLQRAVRDMVRILRAGRVPHNYWRNGISVNILEAKALDLNNGNLDNVMTALTLAEQRPGRDTVRQDSSANSTIMFRRTTARARAPPGSRWTGKPSDCSSHSDGSGPTCTPPGILHSSQTSETGHT